MNNTDFSQIKHILSSCLSEDTKIIDMGCGSNRISEWLIDKGNENLIPMSPEYMEHINHENPFVAYNNFINDERKVPVDDTRADTVLLLGPLYANQEPEKRIETIKEVKRLIKNCGRVITLSNNSSYRQATNKPELIPVVLSEAQVLREAGFVIDKTVKLSPKKERSNIVTIATVKPAISKDAIPPEVIIQIPKETLNTIDISNSDNSENTELQKYISPIEIKPSIDTSLQVRNNLSSEIKRSIDPELQPESIFAEKNVGFIMNLPVLPPEITEIYSNNNSAKELNPEDINPIEEENKEDFIDNKSDNNSNTEEKENFELPVIPIRPSIDKNLVVKADWENTLKPDNSIKQSIDKNLVVKADWENKETNGIIEDKDKETLLREKLDKLAEIHDSIDKSLQMKIPKINPRYAKPKSRKKGTKNLFKRTLR